jgi:hypothetical protein
MHAMASLVLWAKPVPFQIPVSIQSNPNPAGFVFLPKKRFLIVDCGILLLLL